MHTNIILLFSSYNICSDVSKDDGFAEVLTKLKDACHRNDSRHSPWLMMDFIVADKIVRYFDTISKVRVFLYNIFHVNDNLCACTEYSTRREKCEDF